MKQTKSETNIAIFPSPGISHLIPFVEFAKRLIARHDHNFHVTFFIPSAETSPRIATESLLETLPKPNTQTVFLPPVNFDDLKAGSGTGLRILLTITRSLSSLRDAMKPSATTTRFAAFFADPFGVDALCVAKELGVPSYSFIASNAATLSLFLRLPEIDQLAGKIRFMKDLPEPVKIPGLPPLKGEDLLEPIQDRTSQTYSELLRISKLLGSPSLADGFVVNSFEDLEPRVINALRDHGNRAVYPIGPVIQKSGVENANDSKSLAWLENQPRGSVLYVSFGSGGTLSREQLTELALGLEMSGQRFLWVARKPNDESSSGAYLQSQSGSDTRDFLPSGFLERTRETGLVVPNWAPQARILAHGSTGGFLSHCGWSSALESIASGKPMITWPLFAEQNMNAVMLAEGLGVALRPEVGPDGIVRRDDVASVVRVLMGKEGWEVRDRMEGLKEAALKALRPEGTSTNSLSDLASKLIAIS